MILSRSPFVGETEKGDRHGSILAQVTTTQCFLNNADLNESLDLFHIGGKGSPTIGKEEVVYRIKIFNCMFF